MSTGRWATVPTVVIVLAMAGGACAAEIGSAEQRCATSKVKLTGTAVKAISHCRHRRKDAGGGDCETRMLFAVASRWHHLETAGCATPEEWNAVRQRVLAWSASLDSDVIPADARMRCRSRLWRTAAAACQCDLRCVADAVSAGGSLDGACLDRCGAAFGVECRDLCRHTIDCAGAEGRTRSFALEVAQLFPARPPAGPPECPHDKCTAGPPMGDPPCADDCVGRVCEVDPYCCQTAWDDVCIDRIADACGVPFCALCGNGVLEPFEACDDPNGPAGCPFAERCSGDCRRCTSVCGDEMLAADESCDPPGSTGSCPGGLLCAFDCRSCDAVCGDGLVAPTEACDPPNATANCQAGALCSDDCGRCEGICGDGLVAADELCDPPGTTASCPSGTSCAPDCHHCQVVCGDGAVGAGERCDPPGSSDSCPVNESCADGCSTCEVRCGDGLLGAGEECEPASDHCPFGMACRDCRCAAVCGDGIILAPAEQCDWLTYPTGCAAKEGCGSTDCTCHPQFLCGDGHWASFDGLETCDPSAIPSGCPPGSYCSGCTLCVRPCGNGVVDPGEQCDPLAPATACAATEYCYSDCTCQPSSVCGDGQVTGKEPCDGSATPSGCPPEATCAPDCERCVSTCANGVLDPGEQCDPVAQRYPCPPGGYCRYPDCTCQPAPFCGDGHVDQFEACDVAASPACPPGDQCVACQFCNPVCANGRLDAGEACDPTLPSQCNPGEACSATCSGCVQVSSGNGELLPCEGVGDRWTFSVTAGQDIAAYADTDDAATASDLCVSIECAGNLVARGDDGIPCTFPPPAYSCPRAVFRAVNDATCTVTVTTCSSNCVDQAAAGYRVFVTGMELTPVADHVATEAPTSGVGTP